MISISLIEHIPIFHLCTKSEELWSAGVGDAVRFEHSGTHPETGTLCVVSVAPVFHKSWGGAAQRHLTNVSLCSLGLICYTTLF